MPGHIFRQQQFRCAGCGATKRAKLTVEPHAAHDPIAPPPGWFRVDATAQHPDVGAIGTITLFACTEACANRAAAGEGPGQVYLTRFKEAFAPGGTVSGIAPMPTEAPLEAAAVPDDGTGC